ncbi:MAG: TIR domain-containing protein [Planctomycetota bacterium]
MTSRTPLQIHLLFHPCSEHARELAKAMFAELTSAPSFPGPRIPVLYAQNDGSERPPPLESLRFGESNHTLVCLLADDRMARTVAGGAGRAWGDFAKTLLRSAQRRRGVAVLPVALDGGAFHLHRDIATTSFVRLDAKPDRDLQQSELFFQMAVRALELLHSERVAAPSMTAVAPLQVFVSHAKANLPRDPEAKEARGAVLSLLDYLATGPVRAWFDSSQIRPGQHFDAAIEKGVRTSTAFVAVRTDQYSNREWCRREYLRARELDLPIVVVDALAETDSTAFPYFGNVPTVRWREDTTGLSMPRRLVHVLLQEALRFAVVAKSGAPTERRTLRLTRHPDLLSLQAIPTTVRKVVYPDPPLPREMHALLERQRPQFTFTTPMLEARTSKAVMQHHRLGLSVAAASDIHRLGKGDEHLRLLVDDLSILLLLCRAEVGYGGWYGVRGQDYTSALLDRARSLRAIAESQGPGSIRIAPVTHFVSWPKHLDATDEELALYDRTAHLVRCEEPPGLPMRERLAEQKGGFFRRRPSAHEQWPDDLARARWFAHMRGLATMRERMNGWLTARLCVGGKLSEYSGLLPGIVVEALLALRQRKPVFLLAAFGGATELLYDVLAGETREELSTIFVQAAVDGYAQLVAFHREHQTAFETPEQIAAELRGLGLRGLHNGLSLAQNEELRDCTDPFRIAELVAKGLTKCSARRRRR